MLGSRIRTFTDPYSYQAAIRSAHGKILVTARGDFRAELVQIDLPRLWMQRGRENLPRIFHATLPSERAPIGFLAGANQAAVHHCGVEVSPRRHHRQRFMLDVPSSDLRPLSLGGHVADAGRSLRDGECHSRSRSEHTIGHDARPAHCRVHVWAAGPS